MHKKLFIPGPTEVSHDVLLAQAREPMFGHRMAEFSELYHRIVLGLKELFETNAHTMVFTSSATGVMEGTIRNLVNRTYLSTVNGSFSERWFKIGVANGKEGDRIDVEWGKAIKPEMVADALKKKHYEAVLVTYNETSTGVMNPLKEIAAVVREISPDTLILVDAVSALGGAPVEIDEWGVDVIFASVQKCFALPPGLTVTFVSERAIEKAKKVENRGYYFDFLLMLKYWERNFQTPATPAISLMWALDHQIQKMKAETMEKRYARHAEMASIARKWAIDRGFELFAEPGYESLTVTTVKNTREIDVPALNKELAVRGFAISNGYGKLKNKTFRIGHMGDLTVGDLKSLLANIDEIIGD